MRFSVFAVVLWLHPSRNVRQKETTWVQTMVREREVKIESLREERPEKLPEQLKHGHKCFSKELQTRAMYTRSYLAGLYKSPWI